MYPANAILFCMKKSISKPYNDTVTIIPLCRTEYKSNKLLSNTGHLLKENILHPHSFFLSLFSIAKVLIDETQINEIINATVKIICLNSPNSHTYSDSLSMIGIFLVQWYLFAAAILSYLL